LDQSKLPGMTIADSRERIGDAAQANAHFTSYAPGRRIARHYHARPYLSLCVAGGYEERGRTAPIVVRGLDAVMHWRACVHEDHIGAVGLATVVIEFDPHWLERAFGSSCAAQGSVHFAGGALARSTATLARRWLERAESGVSLADASGDFLRAALTAPTLPSPPDWLADAEHRLAEEPQTTAVDLSPMLDLHPAWIARVFRAHRGESMRDSARRRRFARALALLRHSDLPLADIAHETGFCDQAHMNRAFRALIGTTPLRIRASLGHDSAGPDTQVPGDGRYATTDLM
jgi:AraC family transcriptional regulator